MMEGMTLGGACRAMLPHGYEPPSYVVGLVKRVLRTAGKGSLGRDLGLRFYAGGIALRYNACACTAEGRTARHAESYFNHLCYVFAQLPWHMDIPLSWLDEGLVALRPAFDGFVDEFRARLAEAEWREIASVACEGVQARKRRI